ncbi:hypothetical protein SCP_0804490 [Sparassis crispa]|uniref:Uncharacterized protein n=1 Tax=Sparassis crispa TaxID=139825 RepID=A0A401GUL4_9APHY|nr:hypothetical protein SCP_0804490 [Sparassis crispa]GBE85925.1 hypothetical protein SCP_0804490 [Sparassis crispa]
MRSSAPSKFSLFFATAAAMLAVPTLVGANPAVSHPTTTSNLVARTGSLNPVGILLNTFHLSNPVPQTNAQRMARGLPPNRPRFQHSARRIAPRASPAPGACNTLTGTLHVAGTGIDPNTFVSRVPNQYGEYGVTTDTGDALRVQFTTCNTGLPLDLVTLNGIADFTLLGGITGYGSSSSDLTTGSDNYAYLGGTTQTAPHAHPSAGDSSYSFATGMAENEESAIWQVDAASGAVIARWINSDGGAPTTYLVYNTANNVIVLTADPGAFAANFGPGPTVTLTFVEG